MGEKLPPTNYGDWWLGLLLEGARKAAQLERDKTCLTPGDLHKSFTVNQVLESQKSKLDALKDDLQALLHAEVTLTPIDEAGEQTADSITGKAHRFHLEQRLITIRNPATVDVPYCDIAQTESGLLVAQPLVNLQTIRPPKL